MEAFGRSEENTHVLSLLFALLAIPAALWAGRALFGRRAGWFAAALAAFNPFLVAVRPGDADVLVPGAALPAGDRVLRAGLRAAPSGST